LSDILENRRIPQAHPLYDILFERLNDQLSNLPTTIELH